ncbi:MAG: relaxase/mobilization nuclease domain-containing protein [Actinomycetota bacterium]|nr:relaxase/mobilization nuclease domain-containing protein [Actinomycetota bacterium]
MIGSVLPRGRDVGGLLRYLFREGRTGEHGLAADHTDPRLIAAWDSDLSRLEPRRTAAGRRDVRALAAALHAPVIFAKLDPATKPVYHLAIAAAKDPQTGRLTDRPLSDGQWADIAAEYLHQIGLAKRGDEQAVRWVAVRHANDHIHVVATLARQDGRRVFPRNDHYRAREASLTVEARYGLIRTSRAGRTSPRPPSRGETRKHEALAAGRRREGRPGPPAPDRLVLRQLVRAAAASSSCWEQFTERLHEQEVGVRPRMSERNPGQITGYAVALPDQYDTGQTIWFGGGKLAPDLTLPQLQRRWQDHDHRTDPVQAGRAGRAGRPRSADIGAGSRSGTDRFGLTPQERLRLWQSAQDAAAAAATHITATIDSGTDLGQAGDAAWATADLLAVVARLSERRGGGRYTDAARTFEHAGRNLHHAPHVPTPAGRRLRTATTALSAVRVALPSESRELLLLAQRLIALADAVGRLRQTQGQAAQAAAARAAADQLRALQPRPVVPAPSAFATRLRHVSVPYATTTTARRGR